ncbi:MAG: GntR family transcriptional regulator, partial [Angelakisella sp.]
MEILLSNTSGVPIYQQIVTQVRQMIMNGALTEGDSLPSMRLLAKELRISVITTKRAYEELESMGLLVSVAGKGCFVGGASPERLVQEQRLELQGCLER